MAAVGTFVADRFLVGARSICAATTTRLAVAATAGLRVSTYTTTDQPDDPTHAIRLAGYSAELATPPVSLCADSNNLYAIGRDKYFRLSNAVTPIVEATATINCERPSWIRVNGDYVYMPNTYGGVQSIDIDEAVPTALHFGGTQRADFGILDSDTDLLYVLNGSSSVGEVLELEDDGTFTAHGTFDIPNGTEITGGFVDDDILVISTRDRVLQFALDDAVAPVFTSETRHDGYRINDVVLVSAGNWWVATDEYLIPQADRFAFGNDAGIYVGGGLYVLHSGLGRISGTLGWNALYE